MRRRGRLFRPDRELRSITWLNSWLVDGATIIEVGDDRVSWGVVPNRFPSLLILLVSALPAESLFPVAEKVTKNACPCMRPCAARRVRSLHRCSRGRLTRAVPGPLSLSPHPCGSLPYATVPLTLLKGAVGVACGFVQKGHATDTSRSFKRLGLRSPSGGRVEVLRRGTRGRTPSEERRTGPLRQGRPFVTAPGATPERGESGRRPDPDVGVAFSLVTFSWPDIEQRSEAE